MRKIITISLLLLLASCLWAQGEMRWQLNRRPDWLKTSIDPNGFFNFNRYEGCRLGLEMQASFALDSARSLDGRRLILLDGYAAYGTRDHEWKYGGMVGIWLPKSVVNCYSLFAMHDIRPMDSHPMGAYSIVNIPNNIGYLNDRFIGVDGLGFTMSSETLLPVVITVSAERLRTEYLFERNFLPGRSYRGTYTPWDATIGRIILRWKDLTLSMEGGEYQKCSNVTESRNYARVELRYDHTHVGELFGNELNTFLRAGLTSGPTTPFYRMFELGGGNGAYLYFNHAFLTMRPNTFMANNMAQLHLRYTLGNPLWNSRFSKPKLFAQVGAVWSNSCAERVSNPDGSSSAFFHDLVDDRPLAANEVDPIVFEDPTCSTGTIPYETADKGLYEVGLGVKNLIHLGWLDLGAACAYQLTPKSATYHHDDFSSNFAAMAVATILFDGTNKKK